MEQGRGARLDLLSNDDEDIRAASLLDKTASEAEPRISSSSVGHLSRQIVGGLVYTNCFTVEIQIRHRESHQLASHGSKD